MRKYYYFNGWMGIKHKALLQSRGQNDIIGETKRLIDLWTLPEPYDLSTLHFVLFFCSAFRCGLYHLLFFFLSDPAPVLYLEHWVLHGNNKQTVQIHLINATRWLDFSCVISVPGWYSIVQTSHILGPGTVLGMGKNDIYSGFEVMPS